MKHVAMLSFWVLLAFFLMLNHEKIPTSPPDAKVNSEISELLELHNKQRLTRGRKALVIDEELCKYAQKHAEFMARKNKLVHSDLSGIKFRVAGENIAWGQKTAEDVVNSWMWSPSHKANILRSEYKKVGFGITESRYWCVVFGG